MNVVTKETQVELDSNEQIVLSEASCVLEDLLEIMRNNHCLSTRFEEFGYECTISEIQKAIDIMDILSDENPIIE